MAMFRIRRIHDDIHPVNRAALQEVQNILRSQFAALSDADVHSIRQNLVNPFRKRFMTTLYVAEDSRGRVGGFAILMHDPVVSFCYLDYIASHKALSTRGIGGALYQHVREECLALNARGLFYESAPDDPAACSTPALAAQNAARLRFYEQWGARPIINTDYERPLNPGDNDMPHLVYDDLGRHTLPARSIVRQVVKAVLERKYAGLCSPDYVKAVIESITDDPVQLRPLRYTRPENVRARGNGQRVALCVNDRHDIHHVRDRGYVEAPVRIPTILRQLDSLGAFEPIAPKSFSDRYVTAVHDPHFVRYLERVCKDIPPNKSIYPYVFPIRNEARPPKELAMRAGYYCIDTFTPLNANAWLAARAAVDCTLTVAERIARGERFGYALVRPPGHHAERKAFGGFCYLNNNAIAAERLSSLGRVAILDVDYHHGNGQQQIFYDRDDVLTVSIHGHPSFAYPYFSGFGEERGEGLGEGFNRNYPLPEARTGKQYRETLGRALRRIEAFRPDFLIVAFGLDTARGDPTGSWSLAPADFEANGRMIAELRLPTLIVQEGGYRTRTLGTNARRFFTGLLGMGPTDTRQSKSSPRESN
jgi:acetoin utilization deacetylase AcuC-like enzyme/GNAT superfamily N-acetyltransferase